MLSKDAFKKLVLAGAAAAKGYLATEKINKTFVDIVSEDDYDDEEYPAPQLYFEIADECDFREPLSHIVSCIAEIVNTDKLESIIVKYMYVDAVSLFAFGNEKAELYADLVYQYLSDPESAVDELNALDKALPEEELYYVRRYVMLHNEML